MASPSQTAEARIDELEARLALQDQAIQQLSDELYRQQQQIAKLELALQHVLERVAGLALPESATGPANEIPPHY